MKLGESGNAEAARYGRPLDGIRVLALEQFQALPYATQILARLGAEVVKLEALPRGDESRSSTPRMLDDGDPMGHTFLRYNLGKKSLAVDIRSERGRDLVLQLASDFDVFCENIGPGRAQRFGLGYEAMAAKNKRIVYLSISGFGQTGDSPYKKWPAYAHVPEAMCGAYEYSRRPHQPPVIMPMTGLGDSATGLFGVIGVLAALRHRDAIGEGQYIDMAMYDSMISITDTIYNFHSLGLKKEPEKELPNPVILTCFKCADGWLALFVNREHAFERLAKLIGRPEWLEDPQLATRPQWHEHLADILRPGIEAWTGKRGKKEAARLLCEAGVAAAPCHDTLDVINDPHVIQRRMLVEVARNDGVDEPVLVAGNPIKMSKVAEGPEDRYPKLGEHTDALLAELLKLDQAQLRALREANVIAGAKAKGG